MSFTPFLDDLALVEVLLAFVAAVCAYAGVRAWWAIRQNDPDDLRGVLRGAAVPLGIGGAAVLAIALWGEMTWPFLASDGLGGYNIFFFDPLMLLGIVLLAYTVSVFLHAKLQYFGLLALIAGAVVMFYGWTGYTASPAFTNDPLYTFLMYLAFGAAGIAAFPSMVIVDYYLGETDAGRVPFAFAQRTPRADGSAAPPARARSMDARGAQPIVAGPATTEAPASGIGAGVSYRMPAILQIIVLGFPILVALASIAAFWYFGITLPGHLGGGAGGAP